MTRPPRPLREDGAGFVMLPLQLLDGQVSLGAVRLWALLDDICRRNPYVELDRATLAEVSRRHRAEGDPVGSVRSLKRYVTELVDAGWLRVDGRGGGARVPLRYWPLGRPRPVDEPVDSELPLTTDGGHFWPPSTRGRGPKMAPVGTGMPPYRAHVEQGNITTRADARDPDPILDGMPDPRPPVAWCGACDPLDRMLELTSGRVTRCPACHPRRPVF